MTGLLDRSQVPEKRVEEILRYVPITLSFVQEFAESLFSLRMAFTKLKYIYGLEKNRLLS